MVKERLLTPQQELFLASYTNPQSDTFGNALQSALKAGYSPDYADNIMALMPDWLSENRVYQLFLSYQERNKGRTYLYLFKSGDWYKLGYTRDVEKRLSAMKTANPHGVKLVRAVPSVEAIQVEKIIHENLKNNDSVESFREWHKFNNELLSEILEAFDQFDDTNYE